MLTSRFPGICWHFSQLLWIFHPSDFLFNFFVSLLFYPDIIPSSGSYDVKQSPLVIFKICLEEKSSEPVTSEWGSIKRSPESGGFPGSFQTGQIVTIHWGWSFGSSNPVLSHPEVPTLLVFRSPAVETVGSQGLMKMGWGRWQQSKLKHQKPHCFYWSSVIFLE